MTTTPTFEVRDYVGDRLHFRKDPGDPHRLIANVNNSVGVIVEKDDAARLVQFLADNDMVGDDVTVTLRVKPGELADPADLRPGDEITFLWGHERTPQRTKLVAEDDLLRAESPLRGGIGARVWIRDSADELCYGIHEVCWAEPEPERELAVGDLVRVVDANRGLPMSNGDIMRVTRGQWTEGAMSFVAVEGVSATFTNNPGGWSVDRFERVEVADLTEGELRAIGRQALGAPA